MLRVDYDRWNQSAEELRQQAMHAEHARTRERFLALYEITQASCATQIAWSSGRNAQTVMTWVHRYNEDGPDALVYRRTGGCPPFVRKLSRRLGE